MHVTPDTNLRTCMHIFFVFLFYFKVSESVLRPTKAVKKQLSKRWLSGLKVGRRHLTKTSQLQHLTSISFFITQMKPDIMSLYDPEKMEPQMLPACLDPSTTPSNCVSQKAARSALRRGPSLLHHSGPDLLSRHMRLLSTV